MVEDLGTLTVTNSTFSGNHEVGAIFNFGTITVANSTFSSNSSTCDGGAIANSATLTVINSTFSANSAGNGCHGGAITNDGMLVVSNSTFSGNHADFGGGITDGGILMTVSNSTFSANSAIEGGAISNTSGRLTVTNSTFSSNRTNGGTGGGIDAIGGTLTVTNSTFSGNSANGGGDIDNSFGSVSLKSTIIAGSTTTSINCSGTIADAGYNISDDSSCGFSATGSSNNTDPMIDPAGLSNNGGPTQTIALLSGSPAIDAIPLAKRARPTRSSPTSGSFRAPMPTNIAATLARTNSRIHLS